MRNYCSKEKNCGTIFKTVQLRKTGQDPMHFFLAIHVFFLQCMFLKVLAPIRPRYGPDTAPIRPRYGPDMAPIRPRYGPTTGPIRPPKCIFPKIQPPKAGIFWKNRNYIYKELIGAIRGEESWTDLSWFVLLLRTLRDGKIGGFVWKWKVRNQTSWRYFFEAMPPCLWQKSSMKTTALVLR